MKSNQTILDLVIGNTIEYRHQGEVYTGVLNDIYFADHKERGKIMLCKVDHRSISIHEILDVNVQFKRRKI